MYNKIFLKNSYRSLCFTSLRFFWHLLRPKWSIIRGTVTLFLSMFENRQIALIEAKFRPFRNSSKCFTVPRKIDQFERKRCQKKRKGINYKLLKEFLQKCVFVNERLSVKVSLSTYARMLYPGRFILVESARIICLKGTFDYLLCILANKSRTSLFRLIVM